MSIMKNLSTYEKMLENPKNRVKTSMKQPMPGQSELKGADTSKIDTIKEEGVSPEEESFFSAIDKRMALRRQGKINDSSNVSSSVPNDRIQKLEKQVSEMQELMITMMKTHMKLLEKIE